jgi:hypothetical protein
MAELSIVRNVSSAESGDLEPAERKVQLLPHEQLMDEYLEILRVRFAQIFMIGSSQVER